MIIPQRCPGCARVRLAGFADWQDHPGLLPGEVMTLGCPTCAKYAAVKLERDSWRKYNAVERKKARGFGAALAGVDVFQGFRGESK